MRLTFKCRHLPYPITKTRACEDVDAESLPDLATMVESEIATISLAITDQLTGLSNRRGFEILGERLFSVSERLNIPLAVIYADARLRCRSATGRR